MSDTSLGPRVARTDGAAGRGEADRVREQVAEHLLEASRVTADDGGHRRAVEADALALHLRAHRLARFVERVLDAHRARLDAERAADDARHVDQIVEELPLAESVATDDVERVVNVGGQIAARLEHLRPAEDGVQRAAQLVRDRGQEFVAPLRRLERGGAQPGELVDRLLQFADADDVLGGAAGWAGPGRSSPGSPSSPRRLNQNALTAQPRGHHPDRPPDGRVEREQRAGEGHALALATMLPRVGHPCGDRRPSAVAESGAPPPKWDQDGCA